VYIALEGIDTAGKTTQIKALRNIFTNALFTQEPSRSEVGTKIRELILNTDINSKCEFFLFLASRSQHISDVIVSNQNRIIISDRSCVSGMAYAKDVSKKDIIFLNKLATDNIFPDKVIILTLCENELEKRLSLKQKDKIEKRGIKYLLDIQDKMIDFCKELKLDYITIDANDNVDNITKKIKLFIDN